MPLLRSFSDTLRRLAVECSAINLRMKSISSAETSSPGISTPAFCRQCGRVKNAGGRPFFITRSRATIPAAPRHPDSRWQGLSASDAHAGCAPVPNLRHRINFLPAVDGVYRNQDAQLRRDLNRDADFHSCRLNVARYEGEALFN